MYPKRNPPKSKGKGSGPSDPSDQSDQSDQSDAQCAKPTFLSPDS